ncbi:TPA: fimbrial protein [Serratia marcescens]|nr:fimbrial protein [Serratia marcescens]HEJ9049146.1 fimbrial protein [Serratia marcescens]
MKNHFLALFFTTLASNVIFTAHAADGTINFTGEILEQACEVDAGSKSQTVALGKVSKNAFSSAGDTAAATSFDIKLSKCPGALSTASVKFEGTPNATDNNVLALNQETGAATGVGVKLYNVDGSALPLSKGSQSFPLVKGGTTTLNFKSAYVATNTTVTPGPANAVAKFSVIYN